MPEYSLARLMFFERRGTIFLGARGPSPRLTRTTVLATLPARVQANWARRVIWRMHLSTGQYRGPNRRRKRVR